MNDFLFKFIAFSLFLMGTIIAVVRLLIGDIEPVEGKDFETAQVVTEWLCVVGLITFVLRYVSLLKTVGLKIVLTFGLYVIIFIVLAVVIPENTERSGNWIMVISMTLTMIIVTIVFPWIVDKKRRKNNPDGFYEPFMKAFRSVKNDPKIRAECSTGAELTNVDGSVFGFISPIDVESKWKIIEDDDDDR